MKNTGDGRRIARMEKEVQQTVASYLISGFQCPLPALITVTSVRMPADLRVAKVYVSILFTDGELAKEEAKNSKIILSSLQHAAVDFQSYLGSHLKTRYCPKLSFFQDESTVHVLKVERILHDLELEKKSRSE
jgi:ribosome-binding factor A